MRNAQEHFPRLSVPLCNEGFQCFGQAFVSGLVSLDDFADGLVEDQDMIVLKEDPRGDVRIFCGFKSPVFHFTSG